MESFTYICIKRLSSCKCLCNQIIDNYKIETKPIKLKKMGKNCTGNPNPNWPSTTGNPSGGGRGNNPHK